MKKDEKIIKKYCKKYNYGCKIFDDNVIISTNLDDWKVTRGKDKLLVFHSNKAGNRNGKHQYHFQRVCPDWTYVFDVVISRHENYSGVYDKAFKIKDILENLHMC